MVGLNHKNTRDACTPVVLILIKLSIIVEHERFESFPQPQNYNVKVAKTPNLCIKRLKGPLKRGVSESITSLIFGFPMYFYYIW